MTKRRVLTEDEIKEIRLSKTKSYLDSIGVMIPILKDARAVGTTDIIKNKDFMKIIDVFLIDHFIELLDDKLFTKLMNKKLHRKTIASKFVEERLEKVIKELPNIVWDILMTTMTVDSIDNDDSEWLDFEYPIASACINMYISQTDWLGQEISSIGMFDLYDEIADYIDYVSMIISINLFKFSRRVDDNSRCQLMGNIGSIEDIRLAVEWTFLGEVFGDNKNKKWIEGILEAYKQAK